MEKILEQPKKEKTKLNFIEDSKMHLKNSRMTYWFHFKHAMEMSWKSQKTTFSGVIHAIFPHLLKQDAARRWCEGYFLIREHAHLRKMASQLEKEMRSEGTITFKEIKQKIKQSNDKPVVNIQDEIDALEDEISDLYCEVSALRKQLLEEL